MPTGYTAQITSTMSLKEWVLRVAINPDRIPDDGSIKYYEDRIVEEEKELQSLQQAILVDLRRQLENHWSNNALQMDKAIKDNKELEETLNRMLAMVVSWTPPNTERHRKFKEFLVSQITDSLKQDCHIEEWYCNCYPVFRGNLLEWRAQQIKSVSENLSRSKQHLEEEKAKLADYKAYMKLLEESLEN